MAEDFFKNGGIMRLSLLSVTFFITVLILMHTIFLTSKCPSFDMPVAYQNVRSGKVVAAYFGCWDKYSCSYEIENIEKVANIITHVIYAFAKPNSENCTCELSDAWADLGANFEHRKKVGGHFGKLLELKKKYPHLKILLSVGGGTYSKQFSKIAGQGKVQEFIDSIVQLLNRYEYLFDHSKHGSEQSHWFEYPGLFDGVDIDWEWNSTVLHQDVQAYHELLIGLWKKLHKKNMILTSAIQVDQKIIKVLELYKVAQYVDWFHVMTYNYGGPNVSGISMNAPICNQHSGYSIEESINMLMSYGVSPAKMVLGIPLYGHVYDKTVPKLGSPFEKTSKTGAFTYNQIKNIYLDNPDCTTKWHEKSLVPYAYCADDQVFVSYDDESSVKAKFEYAKKKRLQGVFFWRLSGDDEHHSLIRSIKQ
jgi:chitinase